MGKADYGEGLKLGHKFFTALAKNTSSRKDSFLL